MGEAPEVPGFFMCCGMNSMGVASSGGAGKALADWVVDGDPGVDLSSVDVRRFARVRDTLMAVRDRAAENLSLHYAIGYPGHEFTTARRLRLSPLHERLATLGAEFGIGADGKDPAGSNRKRVASRLISALESRIGSTASPVNTEPLGKLSRFSIRPALESYSSRDGMPRLSSTGFAQAGWMCRQGALPTRRS